MKAILSLFAICSICLAALATTSALAWDDVPLAIGALACSCILAVGALLGEMFRQHTAKRSGGEVAHES